MATTTIDVPIASRIPKLRPIASAGTTTKPPPDARPGR